MLPAWAQRRAMSSDLPAKDSQADPAETEPDPIGFLQRGAVVAFTAPQLLGARVRQGKSAANRELILPSFSGTKTPWVIPLNEAGKTQGMTLHDQALWKKLLLAPSLTPAQIRNATLDIAAEGLRGRAAMTFAADHVTTSATAHRRVFFLLLTDLIRRTELPAEAQVPPEQESLTYLRPRIGRAVGRAAKRFNMSVEEVEAALESLAGVFMSLGNAQDAVTGHARQALIDFRAFVKELDHWTAPRRGSPRGLKAEWVLRKAVLTLSCAEAAVAELDRVLGDTTLLIRAWHRDKQPIIARAARPEWLLDGWAIVVALWRQSEPSDREATLWEMAHLVPPLPKEVESWPGFPQGGSAYRIDKIDLSQAFDWRRQRPLDYITRNETLIAGEHAVTLAAEAQKLREVYMVQSTRALTEPDSDQKHGDDPLSRISGRTSKASDTVLRQVVAVLDAVPSRAMLDPIIEAARPRLKLLRPPRPITFTRILFLPFDGALVPMEKWAPGSGKFPRIILTPLAEALRRAMGPEAEEINANLGGQNFFDVLKVDQVGRRLWAEAARLTPGLRLQEALPSIGLDAKQCSELLMLATGIWRHAEGIWEAKLAAFSGPSTELVTAALKGPAQEGQAVFSIALASLLDRAQSPGSVIKTAARLSPIAGSIADEKLDDLAAAPLLSLPTEDPVRAAHMAEEMVSLLKELETAPPGRQTDRRSIISPLLNQIGKASEAAARHMVERQLLPALQNPNAKHRAAIVVNIEHLARALRRIEMAGRRAGIVDGFDELERLYKQRLKATLNALDGGGLQRPDVIRIAEILLGSEQAMVLGGH